MKKGEVWNVEIPASNGREQSGTRPAIVLAEAEAGIAIIIPFTSNIQALKYPHTIEVSPSKTNGLKVPSVALVFQLRAIDGKRLKNKAGGLDAKTLKETEALVGRLLGI